jgi:predicted dehydrogenase
MKLARKQAEAFGIGSVCSTDELIADSEIDAVLNLTNPAHHGPLNIAALKKGKHVYVEKPLAVTLKEAEEMLSVAKETGLRIGCAPDTVLGAGIQTCRKLIDDGAVGKPLLIRASILLGGPARGKHTNPAAFVGKGAGPLFDMGPYFLTAMLHFAGPVSRVTGIARKNTESVTIINEDSPHFGKEFPVEVPTNVSGVLEFESGTLGTVNAVFDFPGYKPSVTVFGTEGMLTVSDPNKFSETIKLERGGVEKEVELLFPYSENSRGLGLYDLCRAAKEDRKHRANEEVALHVTEVMSGIIESAETGLHYKMKHGCSRPDAMPV